MPRHCCHHNAMPVLHALMHRHDVQLEGEHVLQVAQLAVSIKADDWIRSDYISSSHIRLGQMFDPGRMGLPYKSADGKSGNTNQALLVREECSLPGLTLLQGPE